MHFYFDGKQYDAAYRWQSDPDNYPRFTGYVYAPAPSRPGSKHFSQSTNDKGPFEIMVLFLSLRGNQTRVKQFF
jgi:hypothetical protein